jgi:hypothetical protein
LRLTSKPASQFTVDTAHWHDKCHYMMSVRLQLLKQKYNYCWVVLSLVSVGDILNTLNNYRIFVANKYHLRK